MKTRSNNRHRRRCLEAPGPVCHCFTRERGTVRRAEYAF